MSPETLMSALIELEKAYRKAWRDRSFHRELDGLLRNYAGRPTPALFRGSGLTEKAGGARIYIKREDLAHTGSHKINNTPGAGAAGAHDGEAADHRPRRARASMASRRPPSAQGWGSRARSTWVKRMSGGRLNNVFRMRLLGARVNPVTSGSRTLKDAMNEALRDWVTNVRTTYYLIGSTAGPHPYPEMVRDFQSVIGREALPSSGRRKGNCRTPSWRAWAGEQRDGDLHLVPEASQGAALRGGGGGSRSLFGETRCHALPREDRCAPREQVVPSARCDGQILEAHSISAGGWTTPAWGRSTRG